MPGLQKEHIDKIIKWVKLTNIKYKEIDEDIYKSDNER